MPANWTHQAMPLPQEPSSAHLQLLAAFVKQLKQDSGVSGVLLQGSVARGEHKTGSDLDLLVLLPPGDYRPFLSEVHDGILVEVHQGSAAHLKERLTKRPSLAYGIRDGKIQFDRTGELDELKLFATEILRDYSTPVQERESIRYWLYTSQIKLCAALDADDDANAGLLASTNTWKILEGLWAANDLPTPSGGSVLHYLKELRLKPPQFQESLIVLLTGTAKERAQVCSLIISWLLEVRSI